MLDPISYKEASLANSRLDDLFPATNLVANGDFSRGLSAWSGLDDPNITVVLDNDTKVVGAQSMSVTVPLGSVMLARQPVTLVAGHKYFLKYHARTEGTEFGTVGMRIYTNNTAKINVPAVRTGVWTPNYDVYVADGTETSVAMIATRSGTAETVRVWYDAILLIDLTETFGEGEEPTAADAYAFFEERFPGAWFDGTFSPLVTNKDLYDRIKHHHSVIGTGDNPLGGNPVLSAGVRPLYIQDPYGTHQPYHPSVLYFEEAWNGWHWWMAFSPYPRGVDRADKYENPCILVSNDGKSWFVPDGLTNPIDTVTPEEIENRDYMSDPELVYNPDTEELECWYRIAHQKPSGSLETYILRKRTTDGVNWSAREVMIDCQAVEEVVSPALLHEDGIYKMWFRSEHRKLGYGESVDGYTWIMQTCSVPGAGLWHISVVPDPVNGGYALINYYGGDNSLHYHTSTDGINWTYIKQILAPEPGTLWDRKIYRSSPVYAYGKWWLYVTVEPGARYSALALFSGPSLDELSPVDGGYTSDMAVFRIGLRLGTTERFEAPIILADTGECLGFDFATKTLYFQRADGTRIALAK